MSPVVEPSATEHQNIEEETLLLEPVVVVACQHGGQYPDCYDSRGGDWDRGGGDGEGGGGGGAGLGLPEDADNDGDYYDEGPIVWGICILAITGAGISIHDVASAFEVWHSAAGDLSRAERELAMVQENYPNGGVDHATLLLYQHRRDDAQGAYDTAKSAVSGATNVSYLSLAGAALACSASLLLPTA